MPRGVGGMSEILPENWSFTEALEGLLPEMRAFARSLCKDVTLADDLVQDACLKAWSAADSYDPSQKMRPWVFRILRNEFYQKVRREWRWNNLSEEDEAHLPGNDTGDFLKSLEHDRMCAAIYNLPEDQRDALILVLAAGFTYDEAGEICGTSGGTIKSRVSRGRATVRMDLEHGTQAPATEAASQLSGSRNLLNMIGAAMPDNMSGRVATAIQSKRAMAA